ncbi:Stealth CR1 domain-containing protein [Streptococcus parasuis]|uniref:Stealth CR1 domain-containing protein n=1 Tax=Streptococcus parasuis TaxID=1501662 RepID=UPI0028B02C23|nr:Stealth CR1 domain-containing protein [Streptococcus parasuis]
MSTIDFVVMWVDGNDPEWQKEKAKYTVDSNADGSIYRYRDFGLLKYWFRGIEKFAPWANNIFFVTWGHVPEWLDLSNPKLKIVNHSDYIPAEYLPTFSANTIENNLHRIEGLSENFVLFNDDFYLINYVDETDFFKNGKPMDTVALNVQCPQKSLVSRYFGINNTAIINDHFDFKKSLKENFWKWFSFKNGKPMLRSIILKSCPRFPGFWQHHLATSFCKSTFEEVWSNEYETLNQTSTHRFRESTDVNQWLFKDWQIAAGNFEVRSIKFGEAFYIDRDGIASIQSKITNYIVKQKGKMIAINDGEMTDTEFENLVADLTNSFNKILPEKSSFEK